MRSIAVVVLVTGLLAGLLSCMATQGSSGRGGGSAPAPEAAFYCVSGGGRCYPSRDACGQSGFQIGGGWQTSCEPSNSAWCTGPDRNLCASSEGGCNVGNQSGCQLFEGPPPPPPPPHRPDGPPEVLAVLASSVLDPVARPLFCRYVDGTLDAAGPAQLCPAAQADLQPATLDPRFAPPPDMRSWSLRVHLDEFVGDGIAGSVCSGPGCMRLFEGLVELTCDGGRIGILSSYEADGDKGTDPVGPSLVIAPSNHYPLVAGSTCTLVLGDRIVDQTGESIPADQRSYTFVVTGP